MGPVERLKQPIGPAFHKLCDGEFEFVTRRMSELAQPIILPAGDDKMDPHHRSFEEERDKRHHLPGELAGKELADGGASCAIVPIPWSVDEYRNKAFECISSRQHAYTRPFVELENRQRKAQQRILVDLKQFVTRIGLEQVDKRFSGMARIIKSGPHHDVGDLAA